MPRPVAFGGEEWIENAMEMLGRNARAGVGDFDFHGAVVRRRADFQHAAAGHGVARVHEKIQEHLLQARGGAEHRRQLLV